MGYYDLLPELEHEHGEIFKPGLESIMLYHSDEKVWITLVFSPDSGIKSEEIDLAFVNSANEMMFKVAFDLEANARQFLNLDKISLLMVLSEVITEEGSDILLKDEQ
ncbi:hypothetical protein MMU07_03485 [Aquiflexum sp. LQ15W]|uniref:hypothetical protein n=1 Tax=Cognataquiflexum nitidum TaxID=2922272 RepID=UPI001F12DCC4|nr:hypothetical protein [Cognataquiflexum nitidum]MCH6198628.1 hypothetical protein [Cognataquiflexum nitidum]